MNVRVAEGDMAALPMSLKVLWSLATSSERVEYHEPMIVST